MDKCQEAIVTALEKVILSLERRTLSTLVLGYVADGKAGAIVHGVEEHVAALLMQIADGLNAVVDKHDSTKH